MLKLVLCVNSKSQVATKTTFLFCVGFQNENLLDFFLLYAAKNVTNRAFGSVCETY